MQYEVVIRTEGGELRRVIVDAENEYLASHKAFEQFPGGTMERRYRPLKVEDVEEFERKLREREERGKP